MNILSNRQNDFKQRERLKTMGMTKNQRHLCYNMEGDFRQRPASKRAPHFYSPQSSNRNSNVQGYEKSVKAAMKSIKSMVPLNGVDGK